MLFLQSSCLSNNFYPSLSATTSHILHLNVSSRKGGEMTSVESSNSLLSRTSDSVFEKFQACRIHQWLRSCQSKDLFKILIFLDLSTGCDTAKLAVILEIFYSSGFFNSISSLHFPVELWLSLLFSFNSPSSGAHHLSHGFSVVCSTLFLHSSTWHKLLYFFQDF